MRITTKLLILIIALGLISAMIVFAQQQMTQEEQTKMMEKMQEMAQPGPEHKEMAKLEGKWNYKAKLWMSPGANPLVTDGTSDNKFIIGGRFLECKYESMMMGQKFEGMSIFGFDRRNGVFTSFGIDNTGTYSVTAQGPKNKESGKIVMKGQDFDGVANFTQEYEFILNIIDNDHYTFDVIFTDSVMSHGTGRFKMVELEYTRAK